MTLLPLLLLLALIGVLVAAQLLFGQRQLRRAEAQLQRHLQLWLLRRYGPPFEGQQPPQAAFVGALKSHRVLRTQTVLAQPDRQQSDYSLQANVIVQDEQRRFWLVLLELRLPSRSVGGDAAVTLAQPPGVLPLTELRVRRALFNHRADYERAFGEAPTRQRLDAWRRQHPEQEPPDDDEGA